MGVTPGVTRASPYSSLNKTTNNSQGACAQAQTLELSSFDQAVALWLGRGRDRVSPVQAEKAWRTAADILGEDRLLAAARRYLARAGEVQRGHVREFHRWLSERRYEAWIGDEPEQGSLALGQPPALAVPDDVLLAVAKGHGRDTAMTWLGRAEWRAEDRTIIVGATAFVWLRRNASVELRRITVKIEEKALWRSCT